MQDDKNAPMLRIRERPQASELLSAPGLINKSLKFSIKSQKPAAVGLFDPTHGIRRVAAQARTATPSMLRFIPSQCHESTRLLLLLSDTSASFHFPLLPLQSVSGFCSR